MADHPDTLAEAGNDPEALAEARAKRFAVIYELNPIAAEMLRREMVGLACEMYCAGARAARADEGLSRRAGGPRTAEVATDPDYPTVPRCIQCDGPVYICELPDSTCRFAAAARAWLEKTDKEVLFDPRKLSLAALLRATEDAAWERLSVARTKQLEKLQAELERAATSLETLACIVAVVDGPMPTREELRLAYEEATTACDRALATADRRRT
jgi:hypothetical protein